jgi:RNase P/RNase MRP subunit p30
MSTYESFNEVVQPSELIEMLKEIGLTEEQAKRAISVMNVYLLKKFEKWMRNLKR